MFTWNLLVDAIKLEVYPQQKLPREGLQDGSGSTKTPTDQPDILRSVFGTYAAEA